MQLEPVTESAAEAMPTPSFPACCYKCFTHTHTSLVSTATHPTSSTWGVSVGHCRAPIDCSMVSSSPLSCSAPTSVPPPTHSSPMNTRGTCIKTEGQTASCSFSAISYLMPLEGGGVCTAEQHQGVITMVWLHFWGSLMSLYTISGVSLSTHPGSGG